MTMAKAQSNKSQGPEAFYLIITQALATAGPTTLSIQTPKDRPPRAIDTERHA
jgi:hypothetical protein